MEQITYSSNPNNKLCCDSWIDVRLPDPKYTEGNTLEVYVGKNYQGKAQVIEVARFHFSRITNSLAFCCCNGNKYVLGKILKSCYGPDVINKELCSLSLQWVEPRHLPSQWLLFGNAWNRVREKGIHAYTDIPSMAEQELFTISTT